MRVLRSLFAATLASFPVVASGSSLVGCVGRPPETAADAPLSQLRTDADGSSNADVLGRWLLAEMLDGGGDATRAKRARQRLDEKNLSGDGMYGPLARAMYDEAHGAPRLAAGSYVTTLRAAQASSDRDAPLVAWFATHHLLGLRNGVRELYAQHKDVLEPLLTTPGNLGWRALAELYEWRAAEAEGRIAEPDPSVDPRIARELGCSRELRMVGPFGHGSAVDRRRSFPPEESGPWPATFAPDPLRATVPHELPIEGRRCLVTSRESTEPGVFYAETYFDLKTPRDLIVSMQGSLALWVDDTKVLDRDLREWGVWQRFGVAVHLEPGRHRVRGRLLADATSVRLVELDGRPAGIATDVDASRPYAQSVPRVLADPNPIDRFVRARSAPSALTAILASYIAHIEALDDVATVLVDPYSSPKDAAALTLEAAAAFSRGDPAYPEDVRVSTERVLHQRSLKAEPHLWYPAVWLALDDAEQRGPLEAVEPLRKLAAEFPEQPEIALETAGIYGKLGWRAERITLLRSLVARFPDNLPVLREALTTFDAEGPASEGDALVPRIRTLDPDAEVDLDRAIARRDWPAVNHELRRLGARHPERKDLAARMANVLERAGHPAQAEQAFAQALARTPEDVSLRLRLADLAYSRGDETALRKSLAGALEAGARAGELREAIDLAEGASDLEPYRIDGPKVIAEFKAWEKRQGKSAARQATAGNAVRILDYSAVWVHPDGSSEMLEHEIQRMQSAEAIGQESEQKVPPGLVLHLRVIKPDGTVLEPEPVEGKPTLTMPHLEVGDCLEMEHVIREPGDGEKGNRYAGPTWFFREADKGYWRSEFVMVTPRERKLDIEVRGKVPTPEVTEHGPLTERRWRVDDSPPAAEEPDAVPPTEFLPSVRVGWGVNLGDQVARLLDVAVDETPLDPRLAKIAADIAKGATSADDRVRRVYEWVRTNVQDGQETDGRRVVLGRSGARQAAFEHLLRELNVPVDVAIAKNRLALPPVGPMSDVDSYDTLLLRVRLGDRATDKTAAKSTGPSAPDVRWLTVRDRFLPYGYVPAEVRGTEALLLVPGTPRVTLPRDGSIDGIAFEGRADLNEDGSARVHLVERFQGKIGSTLREVLDKVSGAQLKPFVEQRLLGRNMPDARLRDVTIEGLPALDQPLILRAELDLPSLARPLGNGRFAVRSLFPAHLSALATLPTRETPLLLSAASHMETHLTIVLPGSMNLPASLDAVDLTDGDRSTRVHDRILGHALVLDRIVDMPAGRVAPGAPYAAFQRFTQASDTALEREIVVGK